MSIARTQATGQGGLLPAVLAWSTSFQSDLAMAREDVLGSAAHVTMLRRVGLLPLEDAQQLRGALLSLYESGESMVAALPTGEEDIHMAVESALSRSLGPSVAGRLHTARSRNDQVALDLRLFVRGALKQAMSGLGDLVVQLLDRAESEADVILPAYTHRQRAQPISGSFLLCSWAASLVRAGEALLFACQAVRRCPLGAGACSGSSLPINRHLTSSLLGFEEPSWNALDTVGDRDFAVDFVYAASRVLSALGRISGDLVDYSSSEFGFVKLSGQIAMGSSMMPQKKNPDVFELVRGQSAMAIGDLVGLITLVKGIPGGYDRDLQEDRRPLFASAQRLGEALTIFSLSLAEMTFDRARCEEGLLDGFTQATDLAEALVKKGVPFRDAYQAVGALVRQCLEAKRGLSSLTTEQAQKIRPEFDDATLLVLDPRRALSQKESAGGTGPQSVALQRETLYLRARALIDQAALIPSLDDLARRIAAFPLGAP